MSIDRMAAPTNSDIMRELGAMSEVLKSVAEQTRKTNGRVTKIEEWKNALQAVEQYKKEQGPTVHTEQGNVIVQATANNLDAKTKLYLALAALATVAATAISIYAGVNK